MRCYILLIIITSFFLSCNPKPPPENYVSETLKITRLTEHTYIHESYLEIPDYGPFPCNGLILVDEGEAIIFDTPTSDLVSEELINWVENELDADVNAVVINHFHTDCLGGLDAFHAMGIPSHANEQTIPLAENRGGAVPMNGFGETGQLKAGGIEVINRFFGEGHTRDNIVSYIPAENVLFGGCMIKSMGAGKGNLNDANVAEWSRTVAKIKERYPDIEHVVPGHGKSGGEELLDYTIEMFEGDTEK